MKVTFLLAKPGNAEMKGNELHNISNIDTPSPLHPNRSIHPLIEAVIGLKQGAPLVLFMVSRFNVDLKFQLGMFVARRNGGNASVHKF